MPPRCFLLSALLGALLGHCGAQDHGGMDAPMGGAHQATLHSMQMSVERLADLLAAPFEHLALSREALRTEQLSLTSPEDLRAWLLHQALVHERHPAAERRDVFYFVGLETGAF